MNHNKIFVLILYVMKQKQKTANTVLKDVEKEKMIEIIGNVKKRRHYEYASGFLSKEESDWLYAKLLKEVPWRQVVYYKPERGLVTTPRLTWCTGFHQPEYHDIYLPLKVTPQPIPNWLLPLKEQVEEYTDQDYNFVLYSMYRDGKDSIAYHSDDEKFLGKKPKIASVTVGATRLFCLKQKQSRKVQKFELAHGDLFLMKNNCQSDYLHSVPKVTNCLPRISLTFRKALSEAGSKNYYRYNYLDKVL